MARARSGILSTMGVLWQHRQLLNMMVRRDIASRYRGSLMGVAWSLVTPVLMLVVYTFVFAVVFNARWGMKTGHRTDFAVFLFVGLLAHGFLSECLTRAPGLIVGHSNLVKRVVFPLEILPFSLTVSALFNCAINVLVLLAAMMLFGMAYHWSMLLFPLVLLPLIFFGLGVSYLLSSLGVYLRDIAQLTGLVSTLLLFMAPVFYPLEALPEVYRQWLHINPLTAVIESSRAVLVQGQMPEWTSWGVTLFISVLVAAYGEWSFRRSRNGFADVL